MNQGSFVLSPNYSKDVVLGRYWQDGNLLFPLQLPLGRGRVEVDAEGKPPQFFQDLLFWESPRAHVVQRYSSPAIPSLDPIRVSQQKYMHS